MTTQTARTTILSTPGFKAWLSQEAEKEGISVSELVRQRCQPKSANKEELLLATLLEELKKSTERAHDTLDKGLANLNSVLDELAHKRAARVK